jgi:hypothetical protein
MDMIFHDGETGVRARALSALAEIGSTKIVEVIAKLAINEPGENYTSLNLPNVFMRACEAGLGYALGERVYAELAKAPTPEAEKRLKEVLGGLRQVNWAR